MSKRIKDIKISIDSTMDADDIGHQICEAAKSMDVDSGVINILKLDLGECGMPLDNLENYVNQLRDCFKAFDVNNVIFLPIGKNYPIKDIHVEYIKVTEDETN